MPDGIIPGIPNVPGVPYGEAQAIPGIPVPGVPELRRHAEEPPADLRELLAGHMAALMTAKGMGKAEGYSFEISGCLIPDQASQQLQGGWIIILAKKTGLIGEAAHICAPGTLPTGYPSKDQLGIVLAQLKTTLDQMHRNFMGMGNGRPN
jgi:hypothetical protein